MYCMNFDRSPQTLYIESRTVTLILVTSKMSLKLCLLAFEEHDNCLFEYIIREAHFSIILYQAFVIKFYRARLTIF